MGQGYKTKSITVGQDVFTLNTLTATQGLKVFGKLSSMLGFGLQNAFDTSMIAGAIMSKLDDPELAAHIKLLLGGLKKNEKLVEFDIEFSANYGVLSQLVLWAVKENFGSFLADNPALVGLLQKAQLQGVASPSASPTSTGASGVS